MRTFLKEFKEFLIKGSVVDMAVGFIFGAAFATVVKSLVNNIVMPPLGMLLGKVDFSNLFIALDGNNYKSLAEAEKVGAPVIKYGIFLNDLVSFIILGFVIFLFIKGYNRLKKEEEPAAPTTKVCPECAMEVPIDAKKCAYCSHAFV